MAMIDVIRFKGTNSDLVYKWEPDTIIKGKRSEEIRFGSQLIVGNAQEAIFVLGGKICDIFTSGTYTLETKNLPIISSILNIPFGGDSPFSAEVWFVNKAVSMDIKWGIPTFNLIEPTLKVQIPVFAYGSMAVNVFKGKELFEKIVGTTKNFTSAMLKEYTRGIITEKVKHGISLILQEQKISPLEIEDKILLVNSKIKNMIETIMIEFGLQLNIFNIERIGVDENDPKVKKINEEYHKIMFENMQETMRLKRRSENLDVYKTERTFDTTEKLAENISGAGTGVDSGIVGAVLGMGMAMPLANTVGSMVEANVTKTNLKTTEITCSKCGNVNSNDSTFCSKCGSPLLNNTLSQIACPRCNSINEKASNFCKNCGLPFKKTCSNCQSVERFDALFCSKCGKKL